MMLFDCIVLCEACVAVLDRSRRKRRGWRPTSKALSVLAVIATVGGQIMKRMLPSAHLSVSALIAAIGLVTALPEVSRASLVYYTTAALFDAAEPGLPVQTFTTANLYNQPYVVQSSPLNSSTNDAVFAAGSILPGLTISNSGPGPAATGLLVYGDNIGNNWFGDSLILSFSPGVSAVGEDVFANTAYGESFAGNITEDIFNGTQSLGSKTYTETAGGSLYFGVSSTTVPITSVELTWDGDGDGITFARNIAFGPSSASVPEPSTSACLALGSVFFGLPIAILRRRAALRV
jgi:hypothetical protein